MMNELGLYEIYGLSYVPFWQRKWFFWSMGVLMCIIIGICVLLIVRWYQGRKKQEVLSYWQVALAQLHQLKTNNTATVAKGADFYVRLIRILKQYIHQRYQFDVHGRTDAEVVAILTAAQFDPVLLEQIQRIFQGGEYIKFANVSAAQHQIDQDLEGSIIFIEQTCPRPSNT